MMDPENGIEGGCWNIRHCSIVGANYAANGDMDIVMGAALNPTGNWPVAWRRVSRETTNTGRAEELL